MSHFLCRLPLRTVCESYPISHLQDGLKMRTNTAFRMYSNHSYPCPHEATHPALFTAVPRFLLLSPHVILLSSILVVHIGCAPYKGADHDCLRPMTVSCESSIRMYYLAVDSPSFAVPPPEHRKAKPCIPLVSPVRRESSAPQAPLPCAWLQRATVVCSISVSLLTMNRLLPHPTRHDDELRPSS